jgi:hypothetical protein
MLITLPPHTVFFIITNEETKRKFGPPFPLMMKYDKMKALTICFIFLKGEHGMMSVALETRNVYEDFEVETDILFFKVGAQGSVSFHGRNYNIKKRMSAEQLGKLKSNTGFYQVQSDCFVNMRKIGSIERDHIFFGQKGPEAKRLPVSRRKQQVLRSLLPDLS